MATLESSRVRPPRRRGNPHTAEKLSRAFADVPRAEVAKMLGETAAKVYGFDVAKLSSLVAQIGPERVELGR